MSGTTISTTEPSVLDELPAFSALIDSNSFRDVCKSYSDLFGVGIKLFSVDGDKLVDIRANTSEHCGYLFGVHSTRVMCTNLVEKIKTTALTSDRHPIVMDCFSGLRYKIMPIVYEGTVLGRLIFGPYAPGELQKPPEGLKAHEPELSYERLNGFLSGIPRVPDKAVGKVLENMRNVLDVLIHASYKAALTSKLHIASIAAAFNDLELSNQNLKDANNRLRDLDRLKSNFIATVSHELRTPLTSVIGYSEMLLEGMAGVLNDEQRSYIGIILEKGESLLALISQVLDLSRIESGNAQLSKGPTDVREVIRLSLTDVDPQARRRKIGLVVNVNDAVTPIPADFDKIRRIITNLLGNAVKFTPPGGNVHLSAEVVNDAAVGNTGPDIFEPERNRYLQIQVHDTGIGIPADKLQRIFDSFYQVDNSSTREFGGTGLGLSIVRNFVTAHRGRVDVESQEGQGSTFTVKLPYVSEPVGEGAPVDGMMARLE